MFTNNILFSFHQHFNFYGLNNNIIKTAVKTQALIINTIFADVENSHANDMPNGWNQMPLTHSSQFSIQSYKPLNFGITWD